MTTLRDLGERRIVREVLSRRYSRTEYFGNDSAYITSNVVADEIIVASTDPCPRPIAFELGFRDPYYFGWLLAAINFSDLAAAGARPIALLSSLILPAESLVSELERLLDGLDACATLVGATVAGGNLKEGVVIEGTATAIGVCHRDRLVGRSGARPGDKVVFIGEVGDFWAGVLLRRADKPTSSRLLHNILTPLPRTRVAALLAERQVLSSCIDNSDGLWPSLQQLSEASGMNLRVDLDGLQFGEEVKIASRELGLDPRRFALGWGDWNLVGTCGEADIQRFMDACSETETPAQVVGEVSNGRGVDATYNGVLGVMTKFDSERFAADSWFSAGLTSYIDRLLNEPILSQL